MNKKGKDGDYNKYLNDNANVTQYLNWWDADGSHSSNIKLKDDEPDEIKNHADYRRMTGKFLSDSFKDDSLQQALKGSAIDTVDNDDIKSTKEREGMYPNELDQEMKGYKYGDRLSVGHSGGYAGANNY